MRRHGRCCKGSTLFYMLLGVVITLLVSSETLLFLLCCVSLYFGFLLLRTGRR